MKNDTAARALFGTAYDAVPKSVFAVVAWYLSDMYSTSGSGNGEAIERFIQELEALGGQILDRGQTMAVIRALKAANQSACAKVRAGLA